MQFALINTVSGAGAEERCGPWMHAMMHASSHADVDALFSATRAILLRTV